MASRKQESFLKPAGAVVFDKIKDEYFVNLNGSLYSCPRNEYSEFLTQYIKRCLAEVPFPFSSPLTYLNLDMKHMSISLSHSVFTCLTIRLESKKEKNDGKDCDDGNDEKDVTARLAPIVRFIKDNILFLRPKLKNVLFIVTRSTDPMSSRVGVHFPEILLEVDDYWVLLDNLITSCAQDANFKYEIQTPVEFTIPLSAYNPELKDTDVPMHIGLITTKDTLAYSFHNSSQRELVRYLREKRVFNHILNTLFMAHKKSRHDLAVQMFCLLSHVPTFQKLDYILFKYKTMISSSDPPVNSQLVLSYSTHNIHQTHNRSTNIYKGAPNCSSVTITNFVQFIQQKSEMLLLYAFIAPTVQPETLKPNLMKQSRSTLSSLYPPIDWIKLKQAQDEDSDITVLSGDPIVLYNIHNALAKNVAILTRPYSSHPQPLLSFALNTECIPCLFYILFNIAKDQTKKLSVASGVRSISDDDSLGLQVAAFLTKSYVDYFGVSAETVAMLQRLGSVCDTVLANAAIGFTAKTLYHLVFTNEMESLDNSSTQDLCDILTPIVSPVLPHYICAEYYAHQVMACPHKGMLANNFSNAVLAIFADLYPCFTYRQRDSEKYKVFDNLSGTWNTKIDLYYRNVYTIFWNFCLTMSVFNSKPVLTKELKTLKKINQNGAGIVLDNTSVTEGDMDTNELRLLCVDPHFKYKVLDIVSMSLLAPNPAFRLSGRHCCKLPVFSVQLKEFLNCSLRKTEPIFKLIYSAEFIVSFRKKLLGITCSAPELCSWTEWIERYIYALKEFIAEFTDPDLSALLNNCHLKYMLVFYIFVLQTCCFDGDFAVYFLRFTSSLFFKLNSTRKIYFLIGNGGNGKTFYFNILKDLMDTYCGTGGREEFSKSKEHSDMLKNNLFTGLVITVDEISKLDCDIIKAVASNGRYVVRGIYERPTEGFVKCKVLASLNRPPEATFDKASLGRMVAIPFDAHFKNHTEDVVSKGIASQVASNSFVMAQRNECSELLTVGLLFTFLADFQNINAKTGTLDLVPEPDCVVACSAKFRSSCDVYKRFLLKAKYQREDGSKIAVSALKSKIEEFCDTAKLERMYVEIFERFVDTNVQFLRSEDSNYGKLPKLVIAEHIKNKYADLTIESRSVNNATFGKRAKVEEGEYDDVFYFANHAFK